MEKILSINKEYIDEFKQAVDEFKDKIPDFNVGKIDKNLKFLKESLILIN